MVSADMSFTSDVYNPHVVRSLGYNLNLYLSGGNARVATSTASAPLETSGQSAVPAAPAVGATPSAFDVPWSLGIAYSYSGGYGGRLWSASKTMNGVLSVTITPAWRFEYLGSYDFKENTMLTQRFGLTRDLHCWEASFSRTFVVGGEAEYYFRLGIKEQREIFLERGTRLQSFGGIGR
jgi:hypothetical protein